MQSAAVMALSCLKESVAHGIAVCGPAGGASPVGEALLYAALQSSRPSLFLAAPSSMPQKPPRFGERLRRLHSEVPPQQLLLNGEIGRAHV